ncbi:EAL domain-containing protein [Thalassomonas viridans]|uniref:cyclic-guanylate-specific phosphodiesterase n=1 Tax=Thalassomonas viridans TaxID=137584 RepID=A0AAE9Z0B2_9GAMM|nr:EAL domain-containing protein [Thalassomonas viridans]WDE04466.1 EAL domain-containing protein [Thalassomonas viridans]
MTLVSNKSTLTASHLAQRNLLSCAPDTPLCTAAQLIRNNKTSSILIEEDGRTVGIWTEADCAKLSFEQQDYFDCPIREFMSSPVLTIKADTPLQKIVMTFYRHRVRHLLVVDEEEQAIGIVNQTDVIKKQGIEHYLQLRKIKDNYNSRVPVVSGQLPVSKIAEAMAEYKSSSALVKDEQSGEYGIITERDLLHILAEKHRDRDAWFYAAHPLVTIHDEDTLHQAYITIKQNNIRHLVVTNSLSEIVGILSLQHILSDIEIAYVQKLETILTERDDALRESKKSLYFAEKIIEASLDSIMVTDAGGKILSVNSAFTKLTGYSEEEAIGQPASLLSSGRHDEAFYKAMWGDIAKKRMWQGEIWNKKKNGDIYPEWLTIVQIDQDDESEHLFAAIFSDITDRKVSENKIHALAFFDDLTGLPNRRLFNDRFEIALSTAHRNHQQAAVLFLDLDRFKQINDSLGHKVGDELLKAVSNRLNASVKEGDTVSRFGGDEFVILLTEMDCVNDVVSVVERISKVLSQPYDLESKKLHVTPSIGVAIYPDDGEDTDTLLKHADIAMYKAKEGGRNSYQLYTAEMNVVAMDRLLTQNYLRSALQQDELELFYQLQFDSISGQVVGIEALLRWNHPELGYVSPAYFIPMAEEIGIIVDIDRWVLRQACRQRKLWQQQGLEDVRISVNISALHFRHDLIKSIQLALKETGLDPRLLTLEVTEGCLIEDIEQASKTLTRANELGIKNSIDDFGTGFSALSYLTQLPFDTLKIDASFVRKLPFDQQECQIVATIIAMAQGLNLGIVAEGVETREQVDFLTKKGCSIMQGYLYCKPANADNISTQLLELYGTGSVNSAEVSLSAGHLAEI